MCKILCLLHKMPFETYQIHDNGSRPFEVIVDGKKVVVNKADETGHYIINVLEIKKCKQIFIGKDPVYPNFNGNSILVETKRKEYTYIGPNIYTFKTTDDITGYESPVGNSDVPYPYAIGMENTYLMIEHTYIPNFLRFHQDPYQQFYGFYHPYANPKVFDVPEAKKHNTHMKFDHKTKAFYKEHFPMQINVVVERIK